MKSSRRKFAQALAWGAVSAPLAPQALPQEAAPVNSDAIELSMKVIDVKMTDERATQIRGALQNTARQIAAVRAYHLRRDTPPALVLGVFDKR